MISAAIYTPLYILTYELGAEGDGVFRLMILTIPVWATIYWVPDQLFLILNDGKRFGGQLLLTITVGVLICMFADRLLNQLGKKRAQNRRSGNS